MRNQRRSRSLLKAIPALAALGVVVLMVGIILSRGKTPPIEGEAAIASLEKLSLGGANQWVLIRGHDRDNPVLLFLHGGPGMPAMYLAHAFQRELERDFVIVHWDRRGAGKSFEAAEPLEELTVRQTLDDLFELTDILRERFDKDRIILVGHSWGSYLGLLAIHERPESYAAYIGMGQLAGSKAEVQQERREFLEREAELAGDMEMLDRLAAGREPTEDDLFRYGGELYGETSFWPILRTGLLATEYTLADALNVRRGAVLVGQEMKYDVLSEPLGGEIPGFEIPIFFFLGKHDYNTPSAIAAGYLDRLQAPLKGLIWFEDSAHFPFFEEPGRFHAELTRIMPDIQVIWAGET